VPLEQQRQALKIFKIKQLKANIPIDPAPVGSLQQQVHPKKLAWKKERAIIKVMKIHSQTITAMKEPQKREFQ
jgi:hypothetical protein